MSALRAITWHLGRIYILWRRLSLLKHLKVALDPPELRVVHAAVLDDDGDDDHGDDDESDDGMLDDLDDEEIPSKFAPKVRICHFPAGRCALGVWT